MEKTISKDSRISAELDRLSRLFENVDGNQRAIVAPLLQNAAFMRITLEDLQEIIIAEGVTDVYQNGANQHGVKQSATLQSYNALIKNYAAVVRNLAILLPREVKPLVPAVWQPREKTKEDWEEERRRAEEHQQRINEEINAAVEKQRLEREKDRART